MRFRLYFHLVHLAAFFAVASWIQFLAQPDALRGAHVGNVWHTIVGVGAMVLPTFVMLARFMRDEFAEQCWRRAAGTTIYGIFLVPFLLLVAMAIARWAGVTQIGVGPLLKSLDGVQTISLFWMALSTIFVLALEWHRWRAP